MKFLLSVLSLFIAFHKMDAKNDVDSSKVKYTLGITPTALVYTIPSIQLSHDISFAERWGVSVETGLILFDYFNKNSLNINYGTRLRPQINYTVRKGSYSFIDLGMFYNYRYFKAKKFGNVSNPDGTNIERVNSDWQNTIDAAGISFSIRNHYKKGFIKRIKLSSGFGGGNFTNKYSDNRLAPYEAYTTLNFAGTYFHFILFNNISIYF
jgi:hypothetical protein